MNFKKQWICCMTAAVLLSAQSLAAQTEAPQSPDPIGLARIALRVSDLDQEVNFFGKMGFEEAFTHLDGGRTLEVFLKINDMQFIELYPRSDASEPLGFLRVSYQSANLKTLRAKYRAAGLHPAPVRKNAEGDLFFTIFTPGGHIVEFTQFIPDSREMQDRGQHLGDRRVSDALLGFELPTNSLNAAANFYNKLGFDVEQDGANYRLSIPANPGLRIELHSAQTNDHPQFLFPVEDARRAADELRRAGLKVRRDGKLVFLRDPDGNAFVLLETGTGSRHRLEPWRR